MITLRRMSLRDVWAVIPWRNASRAHLRTPTDDTRWSQFKFYLRVILNPWSPHRYRSVYQDGQFVGMVGICHIHGTVGEISLITHPDRRGQGIGKAAVTLAKAWAFDRLGLTTLWGEVFAQNPSVTFWRKLVSAQNWIAVSSVRGGRPIQAFWFQWVKS